MHIFKSSFFFLGVVLLLGLLELVATKKVETSPEVKKCAEDCRTKNGKGKPGPNDRVCGETSSYFKMYEDKCELDCDKAYEVDKGSWGRCKDK